MNLFGFSLKKIDSSQKTKNESIPPSFVAPTEIDGATASTQSTLTQMTFDAVYADTKEQINMYRDMAMNTEISTAIDEIVNDAIVTENQQHAVSINFNKESTVSKNIQKKISDEFENILSLYKFKDIGDELFRQWYVDGQIYFHIVTDGAKKEVLDLRLIDPRKIKKVKEVIKEKNKKGIEIVKRVDEFYIYAEDPDSKAISNRSDALKIPADAIVHVTSNIANGGSDEVVSYLHPAVKPYNQLKHMEDALVIYRAARATERRVFYVDVGNLPKTAAEQYMRSISNKHTNKITYNTRSGTVKNNKNTLSMMEDMWIPRRDGCLKLSTKISTYNGDMTLSELIRDYEAGIPNWTYSVNPETGDVVPGLISWAGVTRKDSELIRVTLDNEETIDATPDHKFILRNGEKVETKDLKVNDSLMPFYSTEDKIFDNNLRKWVSKSEIENIYVVYKITNLVNGKIYVGKHKQKTYKRDGYMGSGKTLKKAIEKYGKENFKFEYIDAFVSDKEALALEAEIVNEEFVNDKAVVIHGLSETRSNANLNIRKIVSIEFLDHKEDVGTLTIDESHLLHDYHNFALACGIFVMNSRGTEVDTLPGGGALGEIIDVEYFKKKLMKSLKVPVGRLEADAGFSLGLSSEITRDEVKFSKFISKLQQKFSRIFSKALKTQIILKKIATIEDWNEVKRGLEFVFHSSSHFAEMKEAEVLNQRLETLQNVNDYVGKYYSIDYVRRNILKQTDEEIENINKQIEQETKDGLIDKENM